MKDKPLNAQNIETIETRRNYINDNIIFQLKNL